MSGKRKLTVAQERALAKGRRVLKAMQKAKKAAMKIKRPRKRVVSRVTVKTSVKRKNPPKGVRYDDLKIKTVPLWWHKQGLSYTASGYGNKIPSQKMAWYKGRWRRIYLVQYSNTATAYMVVNGKRVIVK